MLGRRRRRRANIEPTLVQCILFALVGCHSILYERHSGSPIDSLGTGTIVSHIYHVYRLIIMVMNILTNL